MGEVEVCEELRKRRMDMCCLQEMRWRGQGKWDIVLVGKENRKYLRDVNVIPGELWHRLLVTDLVKKKVKKVVRKEGIERRKVLKLMEDDTRARFERKSRRAGKHLWKCFKERMLKACDEVFGKKEGRRDQGDTWWKEVIARKKG